MSEAKRKNMLLFRLYTYMLSAEVLNQQFNEIQFVEFFKCLDLVRSDIYFALQVNYPIVEQTRIYKDAIRSRINNITTLDKNGKKTLDRLYDRLNKIRLPLSYYVSTILDEEKMNKFISKYVRLEQAEFENRRKMIMGDINNRMSFIAAYCKYAASNHRQVPELYLDHVASSIYQLNLYLEDNTKAEIIYPADVHDRFVKKGVYDLSKESTRIVFSPSEKIETKWVRVSVV